MVTSQQQQDGSGYLSKADSLRRKLKKYLESVNKNCKYGELVEGIDSITG